MTIGSMSFRDRDLLETANGWADSAVDFATATVLSTWGSAPRDVGSFMIINRAGEFFGSVSGGCVENAVVVAAQHAIETQRSSLIEFGVSDEDVIGIGLACGGQIQILIEPSTSDHGHWIPQAFTRMEKRERSTLIRMFNLSGKSINSVAYASWLPVGDPSLGARTGFDKSGEAFLQTFSAHKRVIVIGGVHIAQALVESLNSLDFETIIVDPRTLWANPERFPNTKVVNAWPEDALAEIGIDKDTAIVALTHDPKFDDKAISIGLRSNAFYVGALGGSKSAAARRERLIAEGLTSAELDKLRTPIGLSIGAKGPAEIAVSVVAQLIQVSRGEK